jgi:glycosyltransferase involved in cell wall biosynthesis
MNKTSSPSIPLVSVVIPTYNRARLLPKAVGSVLSQTYTEFEVIVVDDASTDNTEEAINDIADERIRYIRHEENRGGSAARNTGIKAARGEYIAFQDSDDEWLPGKLEKQMTVFSDTPPEVGVVYTGFWRVSNGERIYIPGDDVKRKEGYILKELLRGNFVTTPAIVVRKNCFEKVGLFDELLPRFQDWELTIRLARDFQFRIINEPLVVNTWQKDSLSMDQSALVKSLRLIIEKHRSLYERESRRLLASKYYSLGDMLCREGDVRSARDYMLRSLKTHPFVPAHWIAIFIVSILGCRAYLNYLNLKGHLFGVRNDS